MGAVHATNEEPHASAKGTCLVKSKKMTATKTTKRGTKTATHGTRSTWPSSAPGTAGYSDPINKKSIAAREAEAAAAVARAWLAKAGFHEDPDKESPERIEIGFSDVGADGDRYVNVRVYIPALDIDHVVDGTHPDGITVEIPTGGSSLVAGTAGSRDRGSGQAPVCQFCGCRVGFGHNMCGPCSDVP